MTNTLILTVVLLFLPLIIIRYLMEKALRKLNPEEKIKLLDGFSNQRKYSSLIIFPFLILYLVLLKFYPEYYQAIIAVAGGAFLLFYVISRSLHLKKMKSLEISADYIRTYRISIIIMLLAFACIVIQFFYLFNYESY